MAVFSHLPLGTPIPDRPHAVSCSLPTLAAVCGYEEKDPAVTERMKGGYPRFVVHAFSRRLAALVAAREGWTGRAVWLVSSARMAGALAAHLNRDAGADAVAFECRGTPGVHHPNQADLAARAKVFLQNIGGFLSSRQAEDALVAWGDIPAAAAEPAVPSTEAEARVRRHLQPAFPGASPEALLLAPSGMNAVYAAFRAVDAVQASRGRNVWIQLGWLYLDSISILKKFAGDYRHVADVLDGAGLQRLFDRDGPRIAGVLAEVPTNPLIQTPDVEALAALCRRHGARLIADVSISSAYSVECLPHADLVTASLTKYTGSDGDVIAGVVAVNPAGPDAAALAAAVARELEPVYPRDLGRLAEQIGRTRTVLDTIEASTPAVAAFLSSHPKVDRVYWSLEPSSRDHYLRVARSPGATGGMISFTLKTPLAPFYDRLRLPKGPSFGMTSTLICPFMYLAHYDLVTTAAGRAELSANGLDGDLLRLCVGTEPAAEIIGALAEALA